MKEKKYNVTSKVRYQFIKWDSLIRLRDAYIREDNHLMAKRIAEDAEIQRNKAWDSILEIYPTLKGKSMRYIGGTDPKIVVSGE